MNAGGGETAPREMTNQYWMAVYRVIRQTANTPGALYR